MTSTSNKQHLKYEGHSTVDDIVEDTKWHFSQHSDYKIIPKSVGNAFDNVENAAYYKNMNTNEKLAQTYKNNNSFSRNDEFERSTGDTNLQRNNGENISSQISELRKVISLAEKINYNCGICSESFSQNSYLDKHLLTHTFVCSKCGQSFYHRQALGRHMREQHPHSCSICGISFSQKTLNKHVRTHRRERIPLWDMWKIIFRRCEVSLHMRTHTHERTFSWMVCGISFSQTTALDKHMRTHPQQETFECIICGESFSQYPSLRAHMKKHASEDPLSCSVCRMLFPERKPRDTHTEEHTGRHHVQYVENAFLEGTT